MKRFILAAAVTSAVLGSTLIAPREASALVGSSLGIGLHYLRNLGELETDDGDFEFDENSFGFIGSYQFGMPLITIEANVEYVIDYLGTDESLIEPSIYAVTSGLIYFGVGAGIGHIDGEWQDDPFYALRGGVNFGLGGLSLDVYTTYRFQKDDELEELTGEDLDSLTFAAVLRKSMGG
jgi:hypothetical protein